MSLIFDMSNASLVSTASSSSPSSPSSSGTSSSPSLSTLHSPTSNHQSAPATNNNSNISTSSNNSSIILQAPKPSDIKFFNESYIASTSISNSSIVLFQKDPQSAVIRTQFNPPMATNATTNINSNLAQHQQQINIPNGKLTPLEVANENNKRSNINLSKLNKTKKKVRFPTDDKIIKDYSEPPKRGWMPGSYPTSDLLESYLRSCDKHKCKPLNRLLPQLKALQDIDCQNGQKINSLNLKSTKNSKFLYYNRNKNFFIKYKFSI
jgi:hypothetical protein